MTTTAFPESFMEIIHAAAKRHVDDTTKALAEAERKARALPEFEKDILPRLVQMAILQMIHRSRGVTNRDFTMPVGERPSAEHRMNGHANGKPNGKPVVPEAKVGLPDFLNDIAAQVNHDMRSRIIAAGMNYRIGGKTLGSLKGDDLPRMADEHASNGHARLFLSRLLGKLAEIVPEGKTVAECVNPKRLRKLVDEADAAEAKELERA